MQVISYFLWDHCAYPGDFENRIPLKLALGGRMQPNKLRCSRWRDSIKQSPNFVILCVISFQRQIFFTFILLCYLHFQDVEYIMGKMSPGAKVSETSDLIIHDTEQDIAVSLNKLSARWNLQGEKVEVGIVVKNRGSKSVVAPLHSEILQFFNLFITKTCLYNFDPLKPNFYIVKLGFTGVYINFLISAQNIDCVWSLEPPRRDGSNECPQFMFWAETCKISEFFIWKFSFFGGKISIE